MKKILAEIKAQFESVKGQRTLEEIVANDVDWQDFCQKLRQEAAAEQKAQEPYTTQLPSVSNDQRQFNHEESRKD